MGLLNKVHGAITRLSFGKEAIVPSGIEFLSLKDTLMDGKEVSMDEFKGDVLVVVNVASK